MKRDMDLCRKILQFIETSGQAGSIFTIDTEDLGLAEDYQDVVDHHIKLMVGAGLIDTSGSAVRGRPIVKGLTWEGHEFVETSRDEGLWDKAKKLAKEKTGGVAFGIISPLLTEMAKKALGL